MRTEQFDCSAGTGCAPGESGHSGAGEPAERTCAELRNQVNELNALDPDAGAVRQEFVGRVRSLLGVAATEQVPDGPRMPEAPVQLLLSDDAWDVCLALAQVARAGGVSLDWLVTGRRTCEERARKLMEAWSDDPDRRLFERIITDVETILLELGAQPAPWQRAYILVLMHDLYVANGRWPVDSLDLRDVLQGVLKSTASV